MTARNGAESSTNPTAIAKNETIPELGLARYLALLQGQLATEVCLGLHQQRFLHHGRAVPDGIDPVVDEIDLSAARQLELDGGPDQVRRERRHYRVNRQAIFRRRFDDG